MNAGRREAGAAGWNARRVLEWPDSVFGVGPKRWSPMWRTSGIP